MKSYFIKASRDLQDPESVCVEIYEDHFPARLETSVSISVSDAYDLIEELEKVVRQIDEEMLANGR